VTTQALEASPLRPGSRHEIPIRRPHFDFDASIPNHWLGGNAPATHFFNGLNLVFPDGERFFIRAVRDALPRVADPALREQVSAFFGQEALHAREHERYFARLEAQGYEIARFLRRFHAFSRITTRWLPAPLRLAMTAGAEHWTAAFGAFALADPGIDEAHPTLRRLIIWHATEEIEHKAVAFDVLRAAWPSHALRVLGFAVATLALFAWSIAGTRMLVRQDLRAGRLDRATLRAQRRALAERDGAEVGRRLAAAARAYCRRDFHPNQVDDLAFARRRLAEVGPIEAA
jgi:predicted metal-dependent hydrolase